MPWYFPKELLLWACKRYVRLSAIKRKELALKKYEGLMGMCQDDRLKALKAQGVDIES